MQPGKLLKFVNLDHRTDQKNGSFQKINFIYKYKIEINRKCLFSSMSNLAYGTFFFLTEKYYFFRKHIEEAR